MSAPGVPSASSRPPFVTTRSTLAPSCTLVPASIVRVTPSLTVTLANSKYGLSLANQAVLVEISPLTSVAASSEQPEKIQASSTNRKKLCLRDSLPLFAPSQKKERNRGKLPVTPLSSSLGLHCGAVIDVLDYNELLPG